MFAYLNFLHKHLFSPILKMFPFAKFVHIFRKCSYFQKKIKNDLILKIHLQIQKMVSEFRVVVLNFWFIISKTVHICQKNHVFKKQLHIQTKFRAFIKYLLFKNIVQKFVNIYGFQFFPIFQKLFAFSKYSSYFQKKFSFSFFSFLN